MKIEEHRRWSYGGGAIALCGLLSAAIATRYAVSPTELHPLVFAGLIVFLAAMPLIGIGGLLEAAATGKSQIKLGYITAFVSIPVGILILVLSVVMNAPPIARNLGMAFAAMILVSGMVNLLCARVARLLSTLRPAQTGEKTAA
jgi:hypothetical protein